MRTNIDIDEELMKKAMQISGAKTKREAVENALRTLVLNAERLELLRSMRGKLHWEGNLKEMRRDRPLKGRSSKR